jgi:hypothetical protein
MLRNFQSFERQTVDSLKAGRIPAASYSLPGVCRRATKEITGTENKRSHFSWGRSAARIASGSIGLRQIFLPPGQFVDIAVFENAGGERQLLCGPVDQQRRAARLHRPMRGSREPWTLPRPNSDASGNRAVLTLADVVHPRKWSER